MYVVHVFLTPILLSMGVLDFRFTGFWRVDLFPAQVCPFLLGPKGLAKMNRLLWEFEILKPKETGVEDPSPAPH